MSEAAPPTRSGLPVRTTFLHRPRIPQGTIDRPSLLAELDRGHRCTAAAVIAPAGFGKTVLVSHWCQSLDRPVAWLSLDESIDDRDRFVLYLVAAVRTAAPDALNEMTERLVAGRLPDDEAIIATLSNELDELDEPIVIVLDDYHSIGSPAVHRLMSELLTHPPSTVHFVITARHDPPLPLASMLARGQLIELRGHDLAFDEQQLAQVLSQELERPMPSDHVHALYESTEGWPAGARLAAEALRCSPASDVVPGAGFLDQRTQEYLLAEVLRHIPAPVLRNVVAASYFDRFNADMCDAAMAAMPATPTLMSGAEFVDWLQRHNLFIVPLDDEGVWFRFHQLFARLLESWRREHRDEIELHEAELHRNAARVLRDDGYLDEAIQQLLLAGDVDEAIALVVDLGNSMIDDERWGELKALVATLPTDLVDREPALLMLRAWLIGDHGGRHKEMIELIARAEDLLDQRSGDDPLVRDLRGQIAVLRGTYVKLNGGDFDGALTDADEALRLLAASPGRHLAYAYALGTVALANSGRVDEASRLADSVVGDERFVDIPMDPMTWTRPFLSWVEGDMDALDRYGEQLVAIGEQFAHPAGIATGRYFLGISAYERNDLIQAEEHLSFIVDKRYMTPELVLHSGIALALVELATGRLDEAVLTARALMRDVSEAHSDYYLPTAQALLALVDLRRGRHAAALRWARAADPDVPRHRYMFFDQSPALIEILLSSEPEAPRGRDLLDGMLRSPYGRFNRPVNIKLLGLTALVHARAGDEPTAREALREAVRRSHEGGMIRSLADLGEELTPLLQRLDVTGPMLAHVGEVIGAITAPPGGDQDPTPAFEVVASVPGGPALTQREMDVLRLLAVRYTNREIARELYIAPGTVKKRTVSLYQKLNVHGRREAVAKARALGYLHHE